VDQRFAWALGAAAFLALLIAPGAVAAFDFRKVAAYTDVAASWRLDIRNDDAGGVRAFLSQLPVVYATATLMFLTCRAQRLGLRILTGGSLCYVMALQIMRGEKAPVLFLALFFVFFHHYRRKPLRASRLLAPAIVLYVFAVMISHVRTTTNLAAMTSAAATLVSERPELLLPTNAGELNGPPQTLMVVIEDIRRNGGGFLGVRHYTDELRVWVPRALDRNRPRPASEQYMERFFPVEDSEGRGRGMFILTPGYWAFGSPGIALEMMLYGIVVARIYRIFRASARTDAAVLIYSQCLFVLILMCVRTGLLGTMRATMMATLPFLPLFVFASGGLGARRTLTGQSADRIRGASRPPRFSGNS
jgi:hypothetical protein